jgi:rhomboid protease GluP
MNFRMPMTKLILVLITLSFFAEVVNGVRPFGVGEESLPALYRMGAIAPGTIEQGQWWRLVAAMFLHIGVLHLLINMWALLQLGGVFETMFGSRRFLATYLVSGLAASLASAWFIDATISAGASGAIFGILGALILAISRSPVWRHEPWARSLVRQLIIWAGINVFIGFSFPGIDNNAHLGGFAMGLLLGLVPHKVPPPPPNQMTIDIEPENRV